MTVPDFHKDDRHRTRLGYCHGAVQHLRTDLLKGFVVILIPLITSAGRDRIARH